MTLRIADNLVKPGVNTWRDDCKGLAGGLVTLKAHPPRVCPMKQMLSAANNFEPDRSGPGWEGTLGHGPADHLLRDMQRKLSDSMICPEVIPHLVCGSKN